MKNNFSQFTSLVRNIISCISIVISIVYKKISLALRSVERTRDFKGDMHSDAQKDSFKRQKVKYIRVRSRG